MAKRFSIHSFVCLAGSLPRFLVMAMFFTNSPSATGQWSSNPNVNTPISTAGGDQRFPFIVSDGARGAIIVWPDFRNGFYPDVYAQRVNAQGITQWLSNGTPIVVAPGRQGAHIASDDAGGAILVWTSCAVGDTACDIYAQRVNASGIPQWGTNGVIVCNERNNQVVEEVVSDSRGGAVILWYDGRRGILETDFYVQRINALGVAQWTTNGVVVVTTPARPSFPRMVRDNAGGVIITWHDLRSAISDDIYAQRLDSSGNTLWMPNGVRITNHPEQQTFPKIISHSGGGAIITWQDYRITSGVDYVFAQRIDAFGVSRWTPNGVRIPNLGAVWHSIVSDSAGGAIIAGVSQTGVFGVRAHRINAEGILLWDSNGVALSSDPSVFRTVIISDVAGGALVTWLERRNDPSFYDIYAQRINASGIVQWQQNGVAISTAPGNQFNPAIASDGAGGAIITWEDFRSGTNYDVYAQQIGASGILGQVTSVNERGTSPDGFALHQNYPNPFNPTTTIRFHIPNNGFITLKVYDLLGRQVATLVSGERLAGSYDEVFDGSKLASGVYIYKLTAGNFSASKKLLILK